MEELPLEIKVIGQLLIYIARAGGASELRQCITILKEADPIVGGYVERMANELGMIGLI